MGSISRSQNRQKNNGGSQVDHAFQDARHSLRKMRSQIEAALPEGMKVERLERITLNVLRENPNLLTCDRMSLLGAVMQCAVTGLEPGPLGHAYLVPFKGKVQWIPGYRGLIELAHRSGAVKEIYAEVVRPGDKFKFSKGTDPYIEHVPDLEVDVSEPIVAAYAVAKLRGGGIQFEVMSRSQIERIRDEKSAATSKRSPWYTDFNEMAKKTVFRRLSKWIPVSLEQRDAWQTIYAHDENVIDMDDDANVQSEDTRRSQEEADEAEDAVYEDSQPEGGRQLEDRSGRQEYVEHPRERQREPQRAQTRQEPQRQPQQERPQQQHPAQRPSPEQMHGAEDGQGGSDYPDGELPLQEQPDEDEETGYPFPWVDVDESLRKSLGKDPVDYSDTKAWKGARKSMGQLLSWLASKEDVEPYKRAVAFKYGVEDLRHVPGMWMRKEVQALQETDNVNPEAAEEGAIGERDEYVHWFMDQVKRIAEGDFFPSE